jgi:hypothetical protein
MNSRRFISNPKPRRWHHSGSNECLTGLKPFSQLPHEILADARSGSIVLKKSFLTNERKFLGPLMRFVRGDVRDHIVTSKIDHGSSQRRYRALHGKEV